MSTVTQSVQPNIIPDPLDPNYGPSADNIPNPSSTPGAPVTIASIGNGLATVFYTIANSFIKQPTTGAGYTFRLTFNGYLSAATLSSAGVISVWAQLLHADTSTEFIGGCSNYAATSAAALTNYYSFSAEFIPLVGDTIRIFVQNNTGATITGVTLVPSSRGCAIELVSKASAPVLIFS